MVGPRSTTNHADAIDLADRFPENHEPKREVNRNGTGDAATTLMAETSHQSSIPADLRAMTDAIETASPDLPAKKLLANLDLRLESPDDNVWIETMHAVCFGPGRFARAAYRVREMIDTDPDLNWCAEFEGLLISSVRMTPISVGARNGYMLGPLVTDPGQRNKGAGRRLVRHVTEMAIARDDVDFVLLVGDEPYYGPLGYVPTVLRAITFPAPVDPSRILVHCDPALVPDLAGKVGYWHGQRG